MNYLAHSPTENHPAGQALEDHLAAVSKSAGENAGKFGAQAAAEYCGLLHDIGKYTEAFQKRLAGESVRVDHSTAGAYEANTARMPLAAFAIMGHHGGLPDFGTKFDTGDTFRGRLSRQYLSTLEDYGDFRKYVTIPPIQTDFPRDPLDAYFYTRFLFSALVDADWKDTGAYYGGASSEEAPFASLAELQQKLEKWLGTFKAPSTEINRLRCDIRDEALSHADDPTGLFSLTVPTGGGKTLTSVAFALRHALAHGLERVIYVIPYCSILEQTGRLFRTIFGEENVLLHYSAAEYEEQSDSDSKAYISETWDAPVILTTSVQFFESVFSNQPSRSRKLHNIVKSVIVFDEAQMIPVPYMEPCVCAIAQLVCHYRCSAVLCTATQPSLTPLIEKYLPEAIVTELCPEKVQKAACFHRVTFRQDGRLSNEELAERVSEHRQALCIVNNRAQAQELYRLAKGEHRYCLTTYLTPHDRKQKLAEIKARLQNGESCVVFSTSLVEAGVDLDFPCVWRAISGLDSMIQAGGRCNREGKRGAEESVVHIFEPEAPAPSVLAKNIATAERILRKYGDIASHEAIKEYFDFLLYTLKAPEELDKNEIIRNAKGLNFATVSSRFRVIDDEGTVTLFIPEGEGEDCISALRGGALSRELLRRAAEYAVSVTRENAEHFVQSGQAEKLFDNGYILLDGDCYSPATGLILTSENQAIFI